jgi:hypothetical protein
MINFKCSQYVRSEESIYNDRKRFFFCFFIACLIIFLNLYLRQDFWILIAASVWSVMLALIVELLKENVGFLGLLSIGSSLVD